MNCGHCGTPLPENAAVCSVCGTPVPVGEREAVAELPQPERVGLGLLGALLGAILGGASIVLLSQLGYVAALSGVLMAFCTLKGYELLGKKLSKKGIILSIVLMLVAVLVADWVDWALLAMESLPEYDLTFGECMVLIPAMLADGSIPMSEYLKNLGMVYLFVALGAFGTIRNALSGKK